MRTIWQRKINIIYCNHLILLLSSPDKPCLWCLKTISDKTNLINCQIKKFENKSLGWSWINFRHFCQSFNSRSDYLCLAKLSRPAQYPQWTDINLHWEHTWLILSKPLYSLRRLQYDRSAGSKHVTPADDPTRKRWKYIFSWFFPDCCCCCYCRVPAGPALGGQPIIRHKTQTNGKHKTGGARWWRWQRGRIKAGRVAAVRVSTCGDNALSSIVWRNSEQSCNILRILKILLIGYRS